MTELLIRLTNASILYYDMLPWHILLCPLQLAYSYSLSQINLVNAVKMVLVTMASYIIILSTFFCSLKIPPIHIWRTIGALKSFLAVLLYFAALRILDLLSTVFMLSLSHR